MNAILLRHYNHGSQCMIYFRISFSIIINYYDKRKNIKLDRYNINIILLNLIVKKGFISVLKPFIFTYVY